MSRTLAVALPCFLLAVPTAKAQHQHWSSGRPDGHAPIGVTGDHRHEAGEVMLSYRFMYMNMDGSRVGTDGVTDQAVIDPTGFGFMVTPTKMPMQMHMPGLMYAPHDAVTLMAMLPVVFKEMDHITRMGGTREDPAFTTESGGLGDLKFSALVALADWDRQAAHLNLAVSIPTGSITEQDVLPTSMGQDVQLPYPMQTGSGTWDLSPGVTYLGQGDDWSWGGQVIGTFRLGENDRGWTLGNVIMGTAWGARRFNRNASASVRVEASNWGDIDGVDAAGSVNPAVVPTADTDLRGGTRIDIAPGLNIYSSELKGLRFAAELLIPVYQDLDGPQLEADWTLVIGTQVVPIAQH